MALSRRTTVLAVSIAACLGLGIWAWSWLSVPEKSRAESGDVVSALRSADLTRVGEAARELARRGERSAVKPLKEAQHDLLERVTRRRSRELWEFGDISMDAWRKKIMDRRESPEWRRYWTTLDAVNQAIAELDGETNDSLDEQPFPQVEADVAEDATDARPETTTSRGR
ncbi:MAG: hypothetical protein MK538_12760 [Planctomycetes bacterium]|nr:hypothetical protein [Planctomycetota bacterium]